MLYLWVLLIHLGLVLQYKITVGTWNFHQCLEHLLGLKISHTYDSSLKILETNISSLNSVSLCSTESRITGVGSMAVNSPTWMSNASTKDESERGGREGDHAGEMEALFAYRL